MTLERRHNQRILQPVGCAAVAPWLASGQQACSRGMAAKHWRGAWLCYAARATSSIRQIMFGVLTALINLISGIITGVIGGVFRLVGGCLGSIALLAIVLLVIVAMIMGGVG